MEGLQREVDEQRVHVANEESTARLGVWQSCSQEWDGLTGCMQLHEEKQVLYPLYPSYPSYPSYLLYPSHPSYLAYPSYPSYLVYPS